MPRLQGLRGKGAPCSCQNIIVMVWLLVARRWPRPASPASSNCCFSKMRTLVSFARLVSVASTQKPWTIADLERVEWFTGGTKTGVASSCCLLPSPGPGSSVCAWRALDEDSEGQSVGLGPTVPLPGGLGPLPHRAGLGGWSEIYTYLNGTQCDGTPPLCNFWVSCAIGF